MRPNPSDDIDALKRVLGAPTEMALAGKLGLGRSAIAEWRRRGSVPDRYLHLLGRSTPEALFVASEQQMFTSLDVRAWRKAALSLLPTSDPIGARHSLSVLGDRRDRAVTALMILAMRVTRSELRIPLIVTDADWISLMKLLLTKHRVDIENILTSEGFELSGAAASYPDGERSVPGSRPITR